MICRVLFFFFFLPGSFSTTHSTLSSGSSEEMCMLIHQLIKLSELPSEFKEVFLVQAQRRRFRSNTQPKWIVLIYLEFYPSLLEIHLKRELQSVNETVPSSCLRPFFFPYFQVKCIKDTLYVFILRTSFFFRKNKQYIYIYNYTHKAH